MTTYLILSSIFFIFFIVFCIYVFSQIRSLKTINSNSNKQTIDSYSKLDWKVYFLLILVVALVTIAFYSPYILTRSAINSDFNFSTTGQIGDTIGGLMNPFIALAGVIVTGLAFYIQYKANQQQRELFLKEQKKSTEDFQKQIDHQNKQTEKQEFESQFYEMLNLHRENISEMKIDGYDFEETDSSLKRFEKETSGRKVFVTMKTELECILSVYISLGNSLDEKGFKKCYQLFFSGLDAFEKRFPSDVTFVKKLKDLREQHRYPKDVKKNTERKSSGAKVDMKFNYKPFSGHASRLGHYFRHLYLAVRSTVNSDIIDSYDEKMRYLKLLRAQLSNHEQILLFYNWLGGHGSDWETDDQPFFTKYCMVHNLWHDILLDNEFVERKVDFLRTKPAPLRKGDMFEID